jgi:hypothetical protein
MDLTIPDTFYPSALPHWIGWTLFLFAVGGGAGIGLLRARYRGWRSGVFSGLTGLLVLLGGTMIASMIITFFEHDV